MNVVVVAVAAAVAKFSSFNEKGGQSRVKHVFLEPILMKMLSRVELL